MFNYETIKEIKENKKRIMAIVPVATKNRLTIPKELRNTLNIERGDFIVFLNYQNHIGFVKIKEKYLFENLETDND